MAKLKLAATVRRARSNRGWSQRELADRADVTERTVQNLEGGENMLISSVEAILAALKLRLLVGGKSCE